MLIHKVELVFLAPFQRAGSQVVQEPSIYREPHLKSGVSQTTGAQVLAEED